MALTPASEVKRQFNRFNIGYVGQKIFWTNIAVDHENGTLTNEKLMRMTDEQLEKLSYDEKTDTYFSEMYTRPFDRPIAESQGGEVGEQYVGAHRAYVILEYRNAKRAEQAKSVYNSRLTQSV